MSGLGTPCSALAGCKHSPRQPHTPLPWHPFSTRPSVPLAQSLRQGAAAAPGAGAPARPVAGVLRGESVPSASGQGMGLARAFLCLVPSPCQGRRDAGEALQCCDRPRTLHFPFTSGLSQLSTGSRLTPGSRLFSHPLGGCHHDAAPGAGGPSTAARRLWAASAWLGLLLLPLSCLSPGGRWERQMARGRHELPRLGSRLWWWKLGAGSGLLALPVHEPGVLLGTGPWGQQGRG